MPKPDGRLVSWPCERPRSFYLSILAHSPPDSNHVGYDDGPLGPPDPALVQRFNAYFRKPRLAPPEVDGFPAEFRDRPQFAVFKVDLRENDRGELKWSKVPYNPTTGRRAASDDPATWATLAAAVAAYLTGQYDGIGYFLAEDEGVLFFDLDKSRDEGGGLKPWAAEIVRDLDSFAEYSVTGGGVHVFVRGRKPVERCRPHRDLDPGLEIYGRRRFIALTGLRLPDTPAEIMPRQLAVGQIFARYFPPPSAPAPAPVASTAWVSDDDRLAAGRRSQELGPILQQLYDSDDWAGYRSHSDAVAALANALAFLFGPDPEAVRRQLFASALVRTSRKWQQRGEYLADRAVDLALRNRTSFYQGRPMPAATVPLRDQPAPAGRPATSFKMP